MIAKDVGDKPRGSVDMENKRTEIFKKEGSSIVPNSAES